ncbi:MAG: hypothetical protein COB02_12535 [Candidatus Cloacimonadota bacterium]|nr:MAG: hypothetical protein COB02_12535 [Candidatus Cloacimonadota bacterium]
MYKLSYIFIFLSLTCMSFSDVNIQLEEVLKSVEGSELFSIDERSFIDSLIKDASNDDSILDTLLSSEMISDKNKAFAKEYFKTGQRPRKIRYFDKNFDRKLEVKVPKLQIHGDLDMRLRNVETANDVSNVFSLENATYDPSIAYLLKGKIRYEKENSKDKKVFGYLDLDLQSLDGQQEKINFHFQNKDSFIELGTFLSPYFSEFGLRNTEFSGVYTHLKKDKWSLDFVRGDTVEDYIKGLDKLSIGGLVVKRSLEKDDRNFLGLSYYDMSQSHYLGAQAQSFFINNELRVSIEFMHKDSPGVGTDGNAFEFELDYDGSKLMLKNEVQKMSKFFSSSLNPEYANFTKTAFERDVSEHAITYRFDPYVTSSFVATRRSDLPNNGNPRLDRFDMSWVLITQKPDRPKYMFLIKGVEKDDNSFTTKESQLLAMARTTFRAKDIVTDVDLRHTNFENELKIGESYSLNSYSVKISRPFLKKLRVSERISFLDQNYTNDAFSNESQSHLFEARYQFNRADSIRGSHRYKRVARKSLSNKYKTIYSMEFQRRIDQNLAYKLRLDSYNYNEFSRGYDAGLVSIGADVSF